MYCKYCGSNLKENATFCENCGAKVYQENSSQKINQENSVKPQASLQETGESKAWFGAVLSLLIGVIGLVIGICVYQNNSYEFKTFIKGWFIALVVQIALVVFIMILYILLIFSFAMAV